MLINHRTCLVMFLKTHLDMAEIGKWQLGDTRLNGQSSFARPRISTSNFGIFKDSIIIFMIALSIDNQLTVEWHIWLPYKTNQFYVQHDLLFSSKRPLCGNLLRISAFKFYLLSKSVLIDIKTKKCTSKIRVALGVCFSIFIWYLQLYTVYWLLSYINKIEYAR